MEPPVDEAELARRLLPNFAQEGLSPDYLRFVLQHLRLPDASWRSCCGSDCDPCVDRLGRLVDAARRELGIVSPTD